MLRRSPTWPTAYMLSFLSLCVLNLEFMINGASAEHVVDMTDGKSIENLPQLRNDNPRFIEGNFNPWDTHADYTSDAKNEIPLLHNQDLSEEQLKRSASWFYPLRGKKAGGRNTPFSMSLIPVRGRKAKMVLFPTRGRKADGDKSYDENTLRMGTGQAGTENLRFDAQVTDRVQEDNEVGDSSRYTGNNIDTKSGIEPSDFAPKFPEDNQLHDGNNWEVDRNRGGETVEEGFQTKLKSRLNRRGKRKIFPFVTTWRVFQSLKTAAEPPEGNKREALFFASRGKRSADGF